MLMSQDDTRTLSGLAVVVVHDTPHQLSARLVCQSVRAKLCRLQLLAHAFQQPASGVQLHHQQPACTSTKPAHILAVNIKLGDYRKEEKDAHTSQ